MALRVTTSGIDVSLEDLGVILLHPTVDRDLTQEFSITDLYNSEDLTFAIQTSLLFADDGEFEITGVNYTPEQLLLQELDLTDHYGNIVSQGSFLSTVSGTMIRDINDNITDISLSTGRTLSLTRDGNGSIVSLTDGTYTWTIIRDINDNITGWTVT